MEFGLSKEQALLQESVGRYLDRSAPLERVRRFVDERERRASDVWQGLCELDVAALVVAEEHGGLGLNLLDAALTAEVLGSRVAPVPFAATAVMVPLALALAGSEAQQQKYLPKFASGDIIAGAALGGLVSRRDDAGVRASGKTLDGRALFVLDFEADVYLVAADDRTMYLVESSAPGLSRTLLPTVDGTRRLGELLFEVVPAEPLPGSNDPQLATRVLDAGRILLAADTLGAAQAMLDKAVAYAKQRIQFGRPIGSFQAVKHMCAEMAAELEPCRAMLWYAAYAFEAIPDEARLTACHTKAHICEVATRIARTATEVHGGIGFTDELGLHLWFKRIGANRPLLGSPDQLREEAARVQALI